MLVARLEVLGEIDERGSVRFTVDADTTLRGMDGEPFDVVVENFSRTGFLFVADVEFPIGTLVMIGLSGARAREAKVIRRDGQTYGCEFLVPLPRRELEHAFRGQDAVVADLQAAIERRYRAAYPPPPAPPREAAMGLKAILAALKRPAED